MLRSSGSSGPPSTSAARLLASDKAVKDSGWIGKQGNATRQLASNENNVFAAFAFDSDVAKPDRIFTKSSLQLVVTPSKAPGPSQTRTMHPAKTTKPTTLISPQSTPPVTVIDPPVVSIDSSSDDDDDDVRRIVPSIDATRKRVRRLADLPAKRRVVRDDSDSSDDEAVITHHNDDVINDPTTALTAVDDDVENESNGDSECESEEETIEDVIAELYDRIEPLSAKVKETLTQWASSADACDTVLAKITESDLESFVPSGLRLKAYQLAGLNWAWCMHHSGCNGVLADEMGLGKTVQAVSLLALLRYKLGCMGPHLIVAPSSTLLNWERELNKWCPDLRVLRYAGSQQQRAGYRRKKLSAIADVVLCSYVYFERDGCSDDRSFLRKPVWEYLIADEAHQVKDADSHRYKKLMTIQAQHKLLLTGTPVQNNMPELFAMLRFAMPHVFQHSDTRLFHSCTADSEAVLEPVRSLFAPFVLRRVKSDILSELASKRVVTDIVPMTPHQSAVYKVVLSQAKQRTSVGMIRSNDVTPAPTPVTVEIDSDSGGDDDIINESKDSTSVSEGDSVWTTAVPVPVAPISTTMAPLSTKSIYTDLRKAANHPLLLAHHYNSNPAMMLDLARLFRASGVYGYTCTIDQVLKELQSTSDFTIHRMCEDYEAKYPKLSEYKLPEERLFDSGKLSALKELLPRLISEGHRILIFSQWTMILDVLQYFITRLLKLRFLRLDGSTEVAERQAIIDEFTTNVDIPVMLLSTRAGGLGINLVAADTVILHDLDFNPHVDRQAEDRVHRMGQTKDVTVYKMVCQGTIDDALVRMQEQKTKLHDAVLQDSRTSKESTTAVADLLSAALAMETSLPS